MKPTRRLICGAALALACGAAFAHDDATLAKTKAPNGGQIRAAGAYHLELVVAKDGDAAAERPVVVHVTDHAGAKVATAGATATATLLSSKGRASVALSPAGDNTLKGVAKYPSSADLKAVVSLTMPGKAAEQARFEPFAGAKSSGHMH